MNFILEQFLFYFAIVTVLFLPGWFLMRTIFGTNKTDFSSKSSTEKESVVNFGAIEKFTISFGLSVVSVDFLMILMGRLGILLTRTNILISIFSFVFICWLIEKFKNIHSLPHFIQYLQEKSETFNKFLKQLKLLTGFNSNKVKSALFKVQKKLFARHSQTHSRKYVSKNDNLAQKRQTVLVILILFLTIFIKTIYLQNSIFPTATDLGHHMYWSNLISRTGELPNYEKIKIVQNNDGDYSLSQPRAISDFIIGEHLIFSAVNLISKIPFITYFPTLILFLINIMGILAIFILTLRLFAPRSGVAVLALLLIGPLWAIASPQAKFASGGVIGNLLGNFFIPLCFYFYFLAFREKKISLLIVAIFLTMGMFYTHHLSGFIFLFFVFFIIVAFLGLFALNFLQTKKSWQTVLDDFKSQLKNYLRPSLLIFLLLAGAFLFFVYTPVYLTNHAGKVAVGAPSKATRAGLSFTQFKYAVGVPRLTFGIFGLLLLFVLSLRKNISVKNIFKHSLLIGWATAITLMSLKPQWLHINLPSGRIANYANFPFVILASLALVWIFNYAKTKHRQTFLPTKSLFLFFVFTFTFIFTAGFFDNSQSLVEKPRNQKALQTFNASEYLSHFLKPQHFYNNIVIKDHNYIKADTWMKMFFLQDFSLPFSRSYFKRYNDPTKPREMCTLWMISEPVSERAQKCYNELGVKFVIINPNFDKIQFEKGKNFQKVYAGNDIAIYYYKPSAK